MPGGEGQGRAAGRPMRQFRPGQAAALTHALLITTTPLSLFCSFSGKNVGCNFGVQDDGSQWSEWMGFPASSSSPCIVTEGLQRGSWGRAMVLIMVVSASLPITREPTAISWHP